MQPADSIRLTGESPVDRAAKRELVSTLNGVFADTSVVVVAHYKGPHGRRHAEAAHADEAGRRHREGHEEQPHQDCSRRHGRRVHSRPYERQTLIAYSSDPVAAPKVAVDFAKGNDKLVILGGAMGTTALDANGVKALATMPSLDELRAKIVGLINAPATKIAQVVNAPAAKLARVFGAYAKTGEAA
jgi:large subunit ribosomal protein L10